MTTMPPNEKAPSGAFLFFAYEAVFEAILGAASLSIRGDHEMRITVSGKAIGESPFGVK